MQGDKPVQYQELLDAIFVGNVRRVSDLLEAGCPITFPGKCPALHWAAKMLSKALEDYYDIFLILLSKETDLNRIYSPESPALSVFEVLHQSPHSHFAMRSAGMLLERGADPLTLSPGPVSFLAHMASIDVHWLHGVLVNSTMAQAQKQAYMLQPVTSGNISPLEALLVSMKHKERHHYLRLPQSDIDKMIQVLANIQLDIDSPYQDITYRERIQSRFEAYDLSGLDHLHHQESPVYKGPRPC